MSVFVARYLADGAADASFADAGSLRLEAQVWSVLEVTIDAQDRIAILGAAPGDRLVGWDLDAEGSLRSSRRMDVFFPDPPRQGSDIFAAATWSAPPVVHSSADLSRMASRAAQGIGSFPTPPPIGQLGRVLAVGGILGEASNYGPDLAVAAAARYLPSGDLDARSDGSDWAEILPLDTTFGWGIHVDRDGRATLVGEGQHGTSLARRAWVARLTDDGRPDPTFGRWIRPRKRSGIVWSDEHPALPGDLVWRVVVPARAGAVTAVGYDSSGFVLARYTATGGLDPSFGAEGVVVTGHAGLPLAAGVDGLGRIVSVGSEGEVVSGSALMVLRHLDNGLFDDRFGDGGTARILVPDASSPPGPQLACAVHTDFLADVVTIAGEAADRCIVARWRDGRLDRGFADHGVVLSDFRRPGERECYGTALDVDSQGRVVVAGIIEDLGMTAPGRASPPRRRGALLGRRADVLRKAL